MSALTSPQPALGRDDQTLVAGVRHGDEEAFAELYERYGERIVSYVTSLVGDHARAEDITQDVFISALRRMRVTERPIAFKPWIYEIARNACIDEFRRSRRSQEVPLQLEDDGDGTDRRLVSRAASPDLALECRQQLDDLRGAFGGLSESHHKVLVLRELEGLSYTQIGERLGMTRPVVESTLFRARRRLSTEYEEIASGRRCEQVRSVVDGGAAGSVPALGIRERRRVKRHLSHCQPCRRYAYAAGVDESSLTTGIVEKIAALLPIPAFLRWRRSGSQQKLAAGSVHPGRAAHSIQAAVQWTETASQSLDFERVAAAVAALAVAGGGVLGAASSLEPRTPAPVAHVAAIRAADFPATQPASGPQPMGIAAVGANPLVARHTGSAHRLRPVSHGTQSVHVANASRSSRAASSPSYQASAAPQQDSVAPSTPESRPAPAEQPPTPNRPLRSPLSGLTGQLTSSSSTSGGPAGPLSQPPGVSQITSSVLPQANNVGSQVTSTVLGVANQLTGTP